jgi:hypothetical protein
MGTQARRIITKEPCYLIFQEIKEDRKYSLVTDGEYCVLVISKNGRKMLVCNILAKGIRIFIKKKYQI